MDDSFNVKYKNLQTQHGSVQVIGTAEEIVSLWPSSHILIIHTEHHSGWEAADAAALAPQAEIPQPNFSLDNFP